MKYKIITAAAVAGALALATGCSSTHQSACAPVMNQGQAAETYETAPSTGAPAPEYGTQAGTAQGDTVIPLQKEEVQVAKQQANNGELRVRKYVTTRTINEPVQVREEHVTVQRVPNGPQNAQTALNQPFQGGEITIPLVRETPVLQTQVVPNGAVVIHRQENTQTVNVQGQARSEHVAAEPIGNPQNVTISGDLQGQGAAPGAYGEAAGTSSSENNTQYSTQGGQLDQLCAAQDQTAWAGRQIQVSDAHIQDVISDHLFTVSAANGKTLYVKTDAPTPKLTPGAKVSFNGTVRQVPGDPTVMGWDQTSAQAVQGQKVFIEAPMVKIW